MRRGEIIELWGNRKGEKKIVFCARKSKFAFFFPTMRDLHINDRNRNRK